MNLSIAQCRYCGGNSHQTARTRHVGEGENLVAYHHYLLQCAQCGREQDDEALRHLNAAGAAVARSLVLGA